MLPVSLFSSRSNCRSENPIAPSVPDNSLECKSSERNSFPRSRAPGIDPRKLLRDNESAYASFTYAGHRPPHGTLDKECKTFTAFWLTNKTSENRTGEPRPLDWTLSCSLLWTPSWDVSWELSWESLKGCDATRGPSRGSRFAFACSVRRPF